MTRAPGASSTAGGVVCAVRRAPGTWAGQRAELGHSLSLVLVKPSSVSSVITTFMLRHPQYCQMKFMLVVLMLFVL